MITQSTSLDKLAIVLSGVCIIHCLFTPVLLTMLPIIALSAMAEDLLFHKLMLWIVLPTSSVALFLGCRKHRDILIATTGIVGMVMLLSIAIFGHELFPGWREKLATSVAGLVLACSHFLNYRACQAIPCEDKNCSTHHHH